MSEPNYKLMFERAIANAESLKFSMHGLQDERDKFFDLYAKEKARAMRLSIRLSELEPDDDL